MSDVIKLSSGRYFSFDNPEGFDYRIEELAHALGMICRFTGHTSRHYSVAQHSVVVSYIVPPEHALAGLLHDAHESLTNDLASPLKRRVPDYRRQEQRIERAVLAHFGLAFPLHPEVKRGDLVALRREQDHLFPPKAEDDTYWPTLEPLPAMASHFLTLRLSPEGARDAFLWRYRKLREQ